MYLQKKSFHDGIFMKPLRNISLLLIVIALIGCVGSSKPATHMYGTLETQKICRVAVLPFVNQTQYRNGDIIAYRIFTSELVNFDRFNLVQEGDVRKVYQQMQIFPGESPTYEQVRVIGERLEAEILIEGRIIEMTHGNRADEPFPVLGMSLIVYDAKKGVTLWTTYHRKKGDQYRKVMHFGLVNTIYALVQRMSREILNSWSEVGFKQCTET